MRGGVCTILLGVIVSMVLGDARKDEGTFILMVNSESNVEKLSNSIRELNEDADFDWEGEVKRTHPRINTMIVQGNSETCGLLKERLSDIHSCESDSRIFPA